MDKKGEYPVIFFKFVEFLLGRSQYGTPLMVNLNHDFLSWPLP